MPRELKNGEQGWNRKPQVGGQGLETGRDGNLRTGGKTDGLSRLKW